MIVAFQEALCRLRNAYRRGSSLVLLFDYDGTLTPIVEHPRMAILDRDMRRLLANLADRPRIHVGIVSGRRLDELRSLIPVPGLYLGGTGGMELDLRGNHVVHPHADRIASMMLRLSKHIESDLSAYSEAWLEKKRLAMTVHYRHTPACMVDLLHSFVAEAVGALAGEVRIVQGPMAWEIVPTRGWNKGTAARLILADSGAASNVLFYAGDGANDTEAMAEVIEMGGITLGVGPHAPLASEYKLPDHKTFRAFLTELEFSLAKPLPIVHELLGTAWA